MGLLGYALLALCVAAAIGLLTWSAADPSLTRTASGATRNALGPVGASFADLAMRLLGLAAVFMILPPVFWGLQLITRRQLEDPRLQLMLAPPAVLLLACAASALPGVATWPLPYGLGGFLGDQTLRFVGRLLSSVGPAYTTVAAGALCLALGTMLLVASLGMSLRDVWLICRVGTPRFDLVVRGWRRLVRAGDRSDPFHVRREPTLDMAAPRPAGQRPEPFRVEPAFGYEPPLGFGDLPAPVPSGKRVNLRRPVRDSEFDRATDAASQKMARRFAPQVRDEPSGPSTFGLLRRRWPASDKAGERREGASPEGQTDRKPVWPGSVPAPAEDGVPQAEPDPPSDRDELYGRAVALVRAHHKASTAHLQQSLGIRYMRAADLIDRMEREGIIGPPVHGTRSILARPRVV